MKPRLRSRLFTVTSLAAVTVATLTIFSDNAPGKAISNLGYQSFGQSAASATSNVPHTYPGLYNGPLYATSEQIGSGFPIDQYFANLDRNGVSYMIGMFAMDGTQKLGELVTNSDLGYIINAARKYPGRIVPFFNPGLGGEEIKGIVGTTLTAMYTPALESSEAIAPGLIRGLGEIETQEWNMGHADPRVLQLMTLASTHRLAVMYHPVAAKINDIETIARTYPYTTFLIHMYREDVLKSRARLIEILRNNRNVYFSIDAAHIAFDGDDILYTHDSGASFKKTFDRKYSRMLKDAVAAYTPLVSGVPDKVMWGTEAGPRYSFEPTVYDRLIKISRDFISKMPPQYQEALAYKNALRVFGTGAVVTSPIVVKDTSAWPLCSTHTMDSCDVSCGIKTDADADDPAKDACFSTCLTKNACVDPEN